MNMKKHDALGGRGAAEGAGGPCNRSTSPLLALPPHITAECHPSFTHLAYKGGGGWLPLPASPQTTSVTSGTWRCAPCAWGLSPAPRQQRLSNRFGIACTQMRIPACSKVVTSAQKNVKTPSVTQTPTVWQQQKQQPQGPYTHSPATLESRMQVLLSYPSMLYPQPTAALPTRSTRTAARNRA